MATIPLWQSSQFKHLADLYEPLDIVVGVNGKIAPDTIYGVAPAYTGVACYYRHVENVNDPIMGVGRDKRFILDVVDKIYFAADQEIDDGWIAVNKSLNADGSHSSNYGELHRIEGAPELQEDLGPVLRQGHLKVRAMTTPTAPPGVL